MADIGTADYSLVKPIISTIDRRLKNAQIRQANDQSQASEYAMQQDQDQKRSLGDIVRSSIDPATGQLDKEAMINNAYKIDPATGLKLDQAYSDKIIAQKKKALIDGVYKTSLRPDGTYDEGKVFNGLMGIDQDLANGALNIFRTKTTADSNLHSALLKNDIERKSLLVPILKGADEKSYGSIIPVARIAGIGANDLPDQYDPEKISIYISQFEDPIAKHQKIEDAIKERQAAAAETTAATAISNSEENIRHNKESESIDRYKAANPAAGLNIGQKNDQWTEGQWQAFEKRTNSLNTNSRSALGQSGIANIRAARAMDVLTNKDIVSDPYAFDLVNTDVQGIMKGAAPTESQLKEKYSNLQTNLSSLWQKVSANPTVANQPGVKKQLLTIVNSLRQIDNDVIDRNLGVSKVAFKKILTEDPARAEEYYQALNGTKDVFPDNNQSPMVNKSLSDDDAINQLFPGK